MQPSQGISRLFRAGLLSSALLLAVHAAWAQDTEVAHFDIPSQPLTSALKAFAEQADMQLLYQAEAIADAKANPVSGNQDKRRALEQLLEGTGFEPVYSEGDAVTIRRRVSAPKRESGNEAGIPPADSDISRAA